MTVTAGEAAIRLKPDLTGFASKLRADLQELESRVKMTIKATLKLDSTEARNELRTLAAQKVEIGGIFKTVEFLNDVRKAIRDAQRFAATNKIEIQANFDLNSAEIRSRINALRGGKVTINVDLDTAGARAKAVIFRRFLDALFRNIKIKLEIDNASVAAALAQLAAVGAAIQGLQGLLGALRIGGGGGGGGLGGIIGGGPALIAGILVVVAAIEAAIVAASLLTALIVQLGGSLLVAAGSAVTLTSGLTGLVAVAAGVIVGMQGVGEAFKAAFDAKNVTELKAAVAGLSPNAAAFITTLREMKSEFARIQKVVQQVLFKDLDTWFRRAVSVSLPAVIQGLQLGAGAASQFGKSLLAAFASNQTALDLRNTLFSISPGLHQLAEAVKPLVQGFLSLANGAGPAFNDFLVKAADFLKRFGGAMQEAGKSQGFQDFINRALLGLTQLFNIGGSLIRIISGITTAASKGGVSFAPFVDMFKRLADFVNSPAGQKGLAEFFAKAQDAVVKMLPALEAMGRAFGLLTDALVTLAPHFAVLVSAVLPPLVDMFTTLWEIIKPFAGEIALVLVVALVAVTAAFLAIVGPILLAIAATIAVTIAVSALIQWLISVGPAIGAFFAGVWQALVSFFTQQAAHIGEAIGIIGGFFSGMVANVGEAIGKIGAFFAGLGQAIFSWASGFGTAIGSAVSSFVAGVGRIIVAIGTFVVGLISGAAQGIAGFISGIVSGVSRAVSAARSVGNSVVSAITGFIGKWASIGGQMIQGLVNGIKDAAGRAIAAAVSVVVAALTAAKNAVGVKSPSVKFRKELGWQIGIGLALGLEDQQGRVNAAMQSLLDPTQATQILSSAGTAEIMHKVSLDGSQLTLNVNGTQMDAYLSVKADERDASTVATLFGSPRTSAF